MIVGLVLVRAVRAYLMYEIVDSFLQDEYKESYSTWKAMGTTSNLFSNNLKEEEHEAVENYEEMQRFWSEFGPVSSIIIVISTMSCCSTILCCFSKYRKHLEIYENDPHNPAN